jgi:hypothetical protein
VRTLGPEVLNVQGAFAIGFASRCQLLLTIPSGSRAAVSGRDARRTEHDVAKPWLVVGETQRRTIELDDDENFFLWAVGEYPRDRFNR